MTTYEALREANRTRHERFYSAHTMRPWDLDDWFTATAGEIGEALNVVKKLQRDADGFFAPRSGSANRLGDPVPTADPTRAELLVMLGDEIADAVIYLDIYVAHYARSLALGTGEILAVPNALPLTTWSKPLIYALHRLEIEFRDHATPRLMVGLASLAGGAGIDLGAAVARKFNATSEKLGFPERL